ncbi:SusC/RagA family TonB-linked outer membrane protein [Fulvivirgaceae bacterium PWU4]|uniref:SusC/RagA family TonB-linked outer membrane protein n=1 Tax=Chryseosolibacter histidini TaxID=2782349 RepID=A0AAP2DME3_9BACT|nr:SusC/RagA family TonB-linked outer membrane protein [Chryseosolibacter histidini]MBT1698951.1 SusC/RagA family TonB-linked outer membrane protein [Chryseosolibacter histidini]
MKKLLLTCFSLAIALYSIAQERTISGTVTSTEDGSVLPGVNVVLKGSTTGTSTDADGKYSLTIPPSGGSLIFTFIGLESKEIEIGDRTIVNVSLGLDVTQLSEIIVSGVAGATTREKMTVSVTKVGEAQLTAVPALSLASALTGKVAGLRTSSVGGAPGQQADILLRGDNVLNVSASPLILIDGIIMNGSLADINVDDVESMEVIKGAAASALYGSRAGSGVISITTKRGKNGPSGSPQITIRNEIGFQSLQHYLKTAESHLYRLAPDWEDYQGQYTKYAGVTYPAGYTSGYNAGITGSRSIDTDGYMDNPYGVRRFNPADVFQTGQTMTNYIGVSNRTDKNNIFLSFENNSQEGVVQYRDGYSRQNFRFNIDQHLNDWLTVSASNLYINRKVEQPSGIFYAVSRMEKDVDLFALNPDGQPYNLRVNHFNGEVTNPLYSLYKQKDNRTTRRWLGNYTANVNFASWVNLDVTQTFEIENYKRELINPRDTWNTSNAYTGGGLTHENSETVTANTQITLNLNKQLGDLIIKSKLSYLYEDRHYEYTDASATGFKVYGIEEFNNFPSINNATSRKTTERAQNYFAILGLDYKDRYLFDGMFRYDGSSLFGPDARWNPYYRLSGAYRISQDVIIPGIDELKVRVAHGTAGIRPNFAWQYEVFTLTQGNAVARQRGNSMLKPSQTAETEFGLNANFLQRFTFEGVYAHSVTTDQFLNVPLVPFANDGFSSQWRNAGTIESKTLEFTLGANWVKTNDFSWNSNFVFSRIRQEITELPIPPYWLGDIANVDEAPSGDQKMFRIAQGESYGAIHGHRMVRTLEEMARQLPEGGSISNYEVNSEGYVIPAGTEGTTAELPILYRENGEVWTGKIGDGNAKFNMGIANTFNYKGLTLYILFDWKNGGDVYNGNDQRLAFNNISKRQDMTNVAEGKKKAASYWTAGMYDANFANAYWVEDASYMKLREVAIGYTIPAKVLSGFLRGTIKGVSIKAVGRNLHTFTGYSGYDPEVGTLRQPVDGIGANPIYRNVAFSLGFNL